jgi:hypothetical protein
MAGPIPREYSQGISIRVIGLFIDFLENTKRGSSLREYSKADKTHGYRPFSLLNGKQCRVLASVISETDQTSGDGLLMLF